MMEHLQLMFPVGLNTLLKEDNMLGPRDMTSWRMALSSSSAKRRRRKQKVNLVISGTNLLITKTHSFSEFKKIMYFVN